MSPSDSPSPQPVDIARLRELLAKATGGPWGVFDEVNDHIISAPEVDGCYQYPTTNEADTPDGALTIALRNAAPALLDELERLRKENDEGMREAVRLSTVIWRAEYRDESPDWMPLETIAGVISQIDNMYAGIRSQRDESSAERDKLREEVERQKAKLESK